MFIFFEVLVESSEEIGIYITEEFFNIVSGIEVDFFLELVEEGIYFISITTVRS